MYPGPKPPGQKSPVPVGEGLHWRNVDEFTLLQAACLWAGIEPLENFQDLERSPGAAARYQMLTRAIEAGDLDATHPNPAPRTVQVAAGGAHAPDMLVSREGLEELAASICEQPSFLCAVLTSLPADSNQPGGSRRYSPAALDKWYQDRVENWPTLKMPPTREEDWESAKQEFPGVTQDAVRERRRKHAPDLWKSKGRRRHSPPA